MSLWRLSLYIFIFLHQTTTNAIQQPFYKSCISLYSYIKPQRLRIYRRFLLVVYLYIPTSNHNATKHLTFSVVLYIFIFLHQTTTCCLTSLSMLRCISLYSYIKPQLMFLFCFALIRCISLYSYIKPQLMFLFCFALIVVYLYIPTSNHNFPVIAACIAQVVYLYIPTSNHNFVLVLPCKLSVVYLYIPTSNHNLNHSNISFPIVVYLYIPTSNHNLFQSII